MKNENKPVNCQIIATNNHKLYQNIRPSTKLTYYFYDLSPPSIEHDLIIENFEISNIGVYECIRGTHTFKISSKFPAISGSDCKIIIIIDGY